jgi:hypothetical protein
MKHKIKKKTMTTKMKWKDILSDEHEKGAEEWNL